MALGATLSRMTSAICHCGEPFDGAQDELREEAIPTWSRAGDCFAPLAVTGVVSMVAEQAPCELSNVRHRFFGFGQEWE